MTRTDSATLKMRDFSIREHPDRAWCDVGLPEPPWLRGRSVHKPRARAPLCREEIVTTALRLVRKNGFDALTMRRLGQELGAGGTSSYWYVRDKGQLIDLVIDRLVGEMQVPAGGNWTERLTSFAAKARLVLLDHPGSAALILERSASGPQAVVLAERVLEVLRDAGIESVFLWDAYHSLLTYITGYVLGETWLRPAAARRTAPAMRAWLGALPEERFPVLKMVLHQEPTDSDARFAFGLESLIAGLEGFTPLGRWQPAQQHRGLRRVASRPSAAAGGAAMKLSLSGHGGRSDSPRWPDNHAASAHDPKEVT